MEYWSKALATAGTICSEDLPFKTPEMAPIAPSPWSLRRGTDKFLQVNGLDFIHRVSLPNSIAVLFICGIVCTFCATSQWETKILIQKVIF